MKHAASALAGGHRPGLGRVRVDHRARRGGFDRDPAGAAQQHRQRVQQCGDPADNVRRTRTPKRLHDEHGDPAPGRIIWPGAGISGHGSGTNKKPRPPRWSAGGQCPCLARPTFSPRPRDFGGELLGWPRRVEGEHRPVELMAKPGLLPFGVLPRAHATASATDSRVRPPCRYSTASRIPMPSSPGACGMCPSARTDATSSISPRRIISSARRAIR